MERHAVNVAKYTEHGGLEIANFPSVTVSFVHKIYKDLEVFGVNVSTVPKRRKHSKLSVTKRIS